MNQQTPQTATDLLDEANALFPGRYRFVSAPHGYAVADDTGRIVGRDKTPEGAAKKALTSARISYNNGRRKYAHGEGRQQRSISLLPEQWQALEAKAAAAGLSLSAWLAELAER